MARAARVIVAGCPHHVTQRGNNRRGVFFVDDDGRVFLELLGEAAARFSVTVEGYCLMTNHVHVVATPRTAEGLAAAWRDRLTEPQDEAEALRLRMWTSRGRPLGSDAFLAKVETLSGRRLRPLAHGRPRKAKDGRA